MSHEQAKRVSAQLRALAQVIDSRLEARDFYPHLFAQLEHV